MKSLIDLVRGETTDDTQTEYYEIHAVNSNKITSMSFVIVCQRMDRETSEQRNHMAPK